MSSAFEKAMQDIAKDRTANGGPSLDNLLDAIIAANDDRREATADTDKRLLNLSEAFYAHVADKPIQGATDALLGYAREDVSERHDLAVELSAYKQQVKDAVDAVALDLADWRSGETPGRKPRRRDDPPQVDYGPQTEIEGDMQRAWRIGKWALMAFGIFFIDIFARYVSHIILGYPN